MYNIRKTNNSIVGKLSDRRTNRQTDGQTDESDFIGRCPIDAQRPINLNIDLILKFSDGTTQLCKKATNLFLYLTLQNDHAMFI